MIKLFKLPGYAFENLVMHYQFDKSIFLWYLLEELKFLYISFLFSWCLFIKLSTLIYPLIFDLLFFSVLRWYHRRHYVMPSCDVVIAPPPDETSQKHTPPTTRLLLPAALLKLSAAGEKQQLIKCIVKVVKRAKSQQGSTKGIKRIKSSEDCDSESENKR